jgi:hypothetical protein
LECRQGEKAALLALFLMRDGGEGEGGTRTPGATILNFVGSLLLVVIAGTTSDEDDGGRGMMPYSP